MFPNNPFQIGKTKTFPSIERLVKIAAFFQVSADYLLGIDQRQRLDVSDLPLDVVTHIQMLIDDIRKSPFQQ